MAGVFGEKLRSKTRTKGRTNNSAAILAQEVVVSPPNRYGVSIVKGLEENETKCWKRFRPRSCNVRQEEI